MQSLTAILLLICSTIFVSCEKDDFSNETSNPSIPTITVLDYDLNTLSEQDQVFTLIAKAVGSKFRESPSFRKEFFKKITYTQGRATKDYFVLDFLDDDFDGTTGAEILSPNGSSGLDKSVQLDITAYLNDEAPNTVFKMPKYVETFFWAEELIGEDMSIFTGLPMAVFPATSQTSASNTYVGYGDSVDVSNGLYGIEPQGKYDGYLPIHVKKSENRIVLNQDNYIFKGGFLASAFVSVRATTGLHPDSPPTSPATVLPTD